MREPRFTFTQPSPTDAAELAMFMRDDDVKEVSSLSGSDPLTAVEESIRLSDRAWTVRDIKTGELICVYGFTKLRAIGGAAPWMLGTDLLDEHKIELCTRSKRALPHVLKVYPYLWNIVSNDNLSSIYYLEWLGFKLSKPFQLPNGAWARTFSIMEGHDV